MFSLLLAIRAFRGSVHPHFNSHGIIISSGHHLSISVITSNGLLTKCQDAPDHDCTRRQHHISCDALPRVAGGVMTEGELGWAT
jgi:hypothetical protein